MESRLIGTVVSRRFRVEEVIGRGGMSVVYRAFDLKARQTVALKVLKEEYEDDPDYQASFRREAEVCRRLNHPNIINMVKYGEAGGIAYIAMEYVDGPTLKDVITQNGKLDQEIAVKYTLQILAALAHAHQRGIVHRDVKPQNIMLTRNGQLKIGDFGIARITDGDTLTQDGNVLGSVHYFSPEQAKGMKVTAPSDLYSVGVILYEMLTGHVPFDGETAVSVAMMHLMEKPKPVTEDAEVCHALELVLEHAMEKQVKDRYQNAETMTKDLRRALRHPDGQFMVLQYGKKKVNTETGKQKKQREKMLRNLLILIIIVFVILIGLASYWLYESLFVITRMPDVFGLDSATAIHLIESNGLSAGTEYEYSDISEGFVVRQEPEANAQLRKGQNVTIVVSQGSGQVLIQKVTGLEQAEAESVLLENRMNVGNVETVPSELTPGVVISQDPEAGTQADPGTPVNLTVSGGRVIVPELMGERVEEALETLETMQMVPGEITYQTVDNAKLDGIVLSQSIDKFEEVLPGCSIDLVVGSYDKRKYSAEVTVTVNVPEEGIGVRVTLVEDDGKESDMYAATLTVPGEKTIRVKLRGENSEVMTWRLYLDGAFKSEATAFLN